MILKRRLIIVGAGASGLMAAAELASDFEIVILESRSFPGGRIRSLPLTTGEGTIEAGAEFIHGELPITDKLIREASLTKVNVSGKMYRSEGGKLHRETEMVDGWNELISLMKHQPEYVTMQTFLNQNFSDTRFQKLREHVQAFVHGFDVAPLSEITVKSLYEEWSVEEDQYFLKEGYSALIDHLCAKLVGTNCETLLNKQVTTIEWQKGKSHVTTADGERFSGSHVLITVPLPVLANPNLIQFIPSLHHYREAASNIGFGPVVKVVVDFAERFWKEELSFVFSTESIPTWWSHYPINNNLLTGWVGGPDAMNIYHLDPTRLLEIAYTSLSRIFNIEINDLRTKTRSAHVFNWFADKDFQGAYSYSKPESHRARQVLMQPVENTVFFAGEALFEGPCPGTVEAAFSSALSAAARIRNSLPF